MLKICSSIRKGWTRSDPKCFLIYVHYQTNKERKNKKLQLTKEIISLRVFRSDASVARTSNYI